METFLVGGAVRDALLNLPVVERDWVVIGATPARMREQGFQQVGKDFPVFLHPETHEEFALARTERKRGHGYTGFEVDASPDVTLEEDLQRRDLTINAMARDASEKLIDPYGGQRDLDNKILRHVSPAFAEDPLRVLRVARFAARFHSLGFTIAPETLALMQHISDSGELQYLVAERIWRECHLALQTTRPDVFFATLRACGALRVLMPETDRLFGVPQRADYHPEVDTGLHALLSLQQAALLSSDPRVRFAALVHDLGKAETPIDILPRHIGHEKRSLPLIRRLCERLTVPNEFRDLALLVAEFHTHCHRSGELNADTVLKVLVACRAIHRPERLDQFLLACEADARGRTGWEHKPYPQTERFRQALRACQAIGSESIRAEGFEGVRLGQEIQRRQIAAIERYAPKN